VGKIHFRNGTSDVDVTLIAESGQLLTEGKSHDQQDNGSLSLSRSTDAGHIDDLIIDPGYGGFSKRHETCEYQFHNSVLINGGGVDPNGTWTEEQVKQLVRDIFHVSSDMVVDYVYQSVGGFLTGSSSSDNAAGGGTAALSDTYTNGFEIEQHFNDLSYNYRHVLNYDGEVIVIDHIHSTQDSYAVHWNLPANAQATVRTITATGQNLNSQLRLRTWNSDESNPLPLQLARIAFPTQIVQSATISASGTGGVYDDYYFNFLSVIETADATAILGPEYSALPVSGTSICIRKDIASRNLTRYIFVNRWQTSGLPDNTITINSVATNAAFGIMEFNSTTNALDNVLAYYFSTLTNNGVSLVGGAGMTPYFGLKKVVSNQSFASGAHIISMQTMVELRDVSVNAPASVEFLSATGIRLLPETYIRQGAHARFAIDPGIQ
jgi:hypothetical protein